VRLPRSSSWLVLVPLLSACAALAPRPPRAVPFVHGPFHVAHGDWVFVDPWRPVARAGGAATPRRLVTRVWFPLDDGGAHPLVVYSHGFLSTRDGGAYLAESLASRGYVVAAPDHPLTRWAPWGIRGDDIVNQPGDVSAVIDGVLGWDPSRRPFRGSIDADRIGVMGLSFGGLTTTLVAFHPALRDRRIAAAVSIAGPMSVFGPRFFATASVPFLMIAGEADVIVDYRTNALPVPDTMPDAALVAIAGASHAGFDEAARLMPCFIGNPDLVGCWALERWLDLSRTPDVLRELGAPENGMIVPATMPEPCRDRPPAHALAVGRQQLVTRVAVSAFFESRFAPDPAARDAAAQYLADGLATDFPEATYRHAAPDPSQSRAPAGGGHVAQRTSMRSGPGGASVRGSSRRSHPRAASTSTRRGPARSSATTPRSDRGRPFRREPVPPADDPCVQPAVGTTNAHRIRSRRGRRPRRRHRG
jgi:predicted dienelactone hydrolase